MRMIKIELTEDNAVKFREFMKHYDTFSLLLERGVFAVKNGSVVLDFDKNSTLQTIRFTGFMYSKKHEERKYVEPNSFFGL